MQFRKDHFANAGKMIPNSRFLRVEPLGEGVVDAAGRQERGGGFPLLFLEHYMLQGGISVSTMLPRSSHVKSVQRS
jgi:hypothetical protein